MQFGKQSITEINGDMVTETTQTISNGLPVLPRKVRTEESVQIRNRAEQDEQYIRFADEEERLWGTGRLLEAEFQVRHTPASAKRGAKYAVKKFTVLDNTPDGAL